MKESEKYTNPIKNVSVCPWLSARRDCREERTCKIGESLLLSEKFQRLKDSTIRLYLCMVMESRGTTEFEFPLSVAKEYGISGKTLRRSIQELIEQKFIVLVSSGKTTRKPNVYKFTTAWKLP